MKNNVVPLKRKTSASNRKVGQAQARKMFLQWLQRNDPFLYKTARRVAVMRKQNLSGMGEFKWGEFFQSATDTIKNALPTYLQTKQQKEIMDIQMERARQGLPPLETTQYTSPITISPQISPDTEAAMNRIALNTVQGGLGKLLPWIIGGGLLFTIFLSKK